MIVVAASIWPPKNTVGLIQAVKILKDRRASFRIEWYGISDVYNDYLDQSKKLIKELELEDYINLLPKSKQIQEKYKECDYFCLPSFYEGTPNVICEAMSCGRPIICSKVCDNPVYVAEDENGFLFDPKSLWQLQIPFNVLCRYQMKNIYRIAVSHAKRQNGCFQKSFL